MTEAPTFSQSFDSYVCVGDSISVDVQGMTVTARLVADDDSDAPWDNSDAHGPVSAWTNRDKRAGEFVLHSNNGFNRYYDYAEACKIALAYAWGMKGGKHEGESAKAYAARTAMHDFEVLKAWCNDSWYYVGVVLSVSHGDIVLNEYAASLWRIEANYPDSDNSYLTETANELLSEAIEAGHAALASLGTNAAAELAYDFTARIAGLTLSSEAESVDLDDSTATLDRLISEARKLCESLPELTEAKES